MTSPTLEHAIAERDACMAYLDGEGPDKYLAWIGWRDWDVEIRLLLSHSSATVTPIDCNHHEQPAGQPHQRAVAEYLE